MTRILDIADQLRCNGNEFRYSCSDQAYRYLSIRENHGSVLQSPPLDVEWTEDGSFSSKDFLPHFPIMFNSFLKQLAFEEKSINRFRPRVVVSDSRLSPVVAAWNHSYPVITMLNQFKITFPPRFRANIWGRLYERAAGDVLGLLWSLSDEVLLTDLPPPYTIGVANVQGTDVSNVVRFVGFTSPRLSITEERLRRAKDSLSLDNRPLIFFQVSGPDATKKLFMETVLKSTDTLTRKYNVVVSAGYLNGSGEPRKLANGAWLYDWCPIKDELFSISSLIVARAGHRTIGQCIDAGKPAVLIPIHNHSEQLGNARRFSQLGLGLSINSEDLTPQLLTESVDLCLSDPKYKESIESIRKVSDRYNGIQACADAISSYN